MACKVCHFCSGSCWKGLGDVFRHASPEPIRKIVYEMIRLWSCFSGLGNDKILHNLSSPWKCQQDLSSLCVKKRRRFVPLSGQKWFLKAPRITYPHASTYLRPCPHNFLVGCGMCALPCCRTCLSARGPTH